MNTSAAKVVRTLMNKRRGATKISTKKISANERYRFHFDVAFSALASILKRLHFGAKIQFFTLFTFVSCLFTS